MSEWGRSVRTGRRDLSEPGVVDAFLAGGASVAKVSGNGLPDLVVGFLGVDHWVEVKSGRAKLRASQNRFVSVWRGSPVEVARTPAQARKLMAVWRERRPTLSTVLRAEHDAAPVTWDEAVEAEDRARLDALRVSKDGEAPP